MTETVQSVGSASDRQSSIREYVFSEDSKSSSKTISCRLLVVYRLINSVWVMTVTPAVTNVLLCTQLIAATARLLVAACKGVDVTPDKIARKYPEVSSNISTSRLNLTTTTSVISFHFRGCNAFGSMSFPSES